MFSPLRITLYILLFLGLVLGFFYIVLEQPSYFYSVATSTPAPTKEIIIQTTQTPPPATPTPTIITATPTPTQVPITYYTVQPGDTLEKIAQEHDLNWLQLANYNQLSNPNSLQIGQIIKISHDPEDYEDISPYYQAEIYQAKENEKHILVVLSEQRLYTYEGDTLLNSYLISSGTANYPTVTGVFKVWIKLESTTMSGGSGADAYYLPDVPYTMYFYGDYGIHGTYWHNNFGTPMSHGCVNMRTEDAQEVFEWAEVGTIVQVIP